MMEFMAKRTVDAVFASDYPRLWRALFAYAGDREVASDAASEAYTQAIRRGSAITDPSAWIWRSAFKIAAGLLHERRHTVPVDRVVEIAWTSAPVVDLLESLGQLSPQQRAIVSLRYVAEFDIAQIAEALDTSTNTVRVQLHRAHRTLRRTFGVIDE